MLTQTRSRAGPDEAAHRGGDSDEGRDSGQPGARAGLGGRHPAGWASGSRQRCGVQLFWAAVQGWAALADEIQQV
jgi:hypothetical protein